MSAAVSTLFTAPKNAKPQINLIINGGVLMKRSQMKKRKNFNLMKDQEEGLQV